MIRVQPRFLPPLIRREWQENRGLFGWSQVGVLGFVLGVVFLALAFGSVADLTGGTEWSDGDDRVSEHFEGRLLPLLTGQFARLADVPFEERQELYRNARVALAGIFQIVLYLTILFYLAGTLYDDRRDHSVLFWKSMPVSDAETVLSKLLTAMFLAPVLALGAAFAAQFVLLLILTVIAWAAGVSALQTVWLPSGLLTGVGKLLAISVMHAFWALPLYGWVLLVSATARRAPLLWALLIPVFVYVLERIVFGGSVVARFFRDHLSVGRYEDLIAGPVGPVLMDFLTDPSLWVGLVVAAALLAGTVYSRRRFNEI